jgi:hypothetical protein
LARASEQCQFSWRSAFSQPGPTAVAFPSPNLSCVITSCLLRPCAAHWHLAILC